MLGTVGTWLAAIGTLAMMSFAWRENPFYRAFEHIYIGIGAGHATVMGWQNIQSNLIRPLQVDRHFLSLVPLVLGLLLYTRFIKGQAYLSRYPIAVLVGVGTGLTLRGTVGSQLVEQVKATMIPLNNINNIILVLGTTATVLFFYFTAKKSNKAMGVTSKIGRYIMMIAFGATFGNAVMGRMSMMIGRVTFLLRDWLSIL